MGRTASSFSPPCAAAETSGDWPSGRDVGRWAGPSLHGTGCAKRCVGGRDLGVGSGGILQATQGTLGWT